MPGTRLRGLSTSRIPGSPSPFVVGLPHRFSSKVAAKTVEAFKTIYFEVWYYLYVLFTAKEKIAR